MYIDPDQDSNTLAPEEYKIMVWGSLLDSVKNVKNSTVFCNRQVNKNRFFFVIVYINCFVFSDKTDIQKNKLLFVLFPQVFFAAARFHCHTVQRITSCATFLSVFSKLAAFQRSNRNNTPANSQNTATALVSAETMMVLGTSNISPAATSYHATDDTNDNTNRTITKRSAQSVLTLCHKRVVTRWMMEEVQSSGTERHIKSRAAK